MKVDEEQTFSIEELHTSIRLPDYFSLRDIRIYISTIFFSAIVATSAWAIFKTSASFILPIGLVLILHPFLMFKLRDQIAFVTVKRMRG